MTAEHPRTRADLKGTEVSAALAKAAENAVRVCLGATAADRAVVVHDAQAAAIAAALCDAFEAVGAKCAACDVGDHGGRPLTVLPGAIAKALSGATVSALAMTSMPGEASLRKAVLGITVEHRLRHAHMPSISEAVFVDGLSMDYRQVSTFMDRVVAALGGASGLRMTSPGGTDLECRFRDPPAFEKLDGLIAPGSWQNLPSGQIVIQPAGAEGVFVADSNLGDWFEHNYRISDHPVRFEFEECRIRQIRCDNKKLERDLRLFLRSSTDSGKISEVVIGTNLGLTQGHRSALFDGYRPGASITVGAFPSPTKQWTSATTVPIFGVRGSLSVGGRRIMTDDVFADDLLKDP